VERIAARGGEAVLGLRDALRDDESPYLMRLLQALGDLRPCRVEPPRPDAPLMRAALNSERIPMMELLVAHGADVNAAWHGDYPILFAACETLNPITLCWLLEHGADPNWSLWGSRPRCGGCRRWKRLRRYQRLSVWNRYRRNRRTGWLRQLSGKVDLPGRGCLIIERR